MITEFNKLFLIHRPTLAALARLLKKALTKLIISANLIGSKKWFKQTVCSMAGIRLPDCLKLSEKTGSLIATLLPFVAEC